jgi:hypothetical protein
MSDVSARLALPLIQPSQAQKHVTHNEALLILDVAAQLVVDAFDAVTPPASPIEGALFALASNPDGDWAGQAGMLALWWDSQWRYFHPQETWRAGLSGSAEVFVRQGGTWVPQEIATDNLPSVGVNTTADPTNRLAVRAQQTLLSHEGAGHRLTLNKASAADSAEIVFQTNWSGRTVFALDSGDALTLKLSADGSSWVNATIWDLATGHVGFGVFSPARPVHIYGALRLEPGTEPSSPAAGDLYFDSTLSKLRCYDGAGWHDLF